MHRGGMAVSMHVAMKQAGVGCERVGLLDQGATLITLFSLPKQLGHLSVL
jgi:hypothetical protein